MNAEVNHGRWIAACITPYCTEAHLVTPGDRFICDNCGTDHGPIRFPDDMPLINAVLGARKVPQTRNWLLTETVADLIAENKAHGE